MNDNKLIAEFMGHTFGDYDLGGLHYLIDGNYVEYNSLQYDASWDWLMPVLSKILDLSFQDDGDAEDFYSIRDCVPDINHTYKAVVEFIKKHNNQDTEDEACDMLHGKKYCMYVVDSNEEDFDKGVAGYDEVKNCAIDYTESDDFESLLRLLVSGINNEEYSDQNWYYITDENEGIILMS